MGKYEDALERAKAFIKRGGEYDRQVMESIFPELKESEDEKIRKELLALVRMNVLPEATCLVRGGSVTKSQAEAYLERQKEQKPVHTAKEAWKKMRRSILEQACGNCHEPNYTDASTKMFSLCDIDEIFDEIGDSTVGSQSAEWSEEDEKHLNWVIEHFRQGGSLYDNLIYWLTQLPKRFNLQSHWKPSEEQINALKIVARGFQADNPDAIDSLLSDLQKLL